VRVALRPSPYGGTTAVVLMPNSIVVPLNEAEADTHPDLRQPSGRQPGLDRRLADAFSLTGQQSAQPTLSGASADAAATGDRGSGPDLGSASAARDSASDVPGSASTAPAPPGFAPRPGPPSGWPGPAPAQPGPLPARKRGFAPGQPGFGAGSPAPSQPGFGAGSPAPSQPGFGAGSPAPSQPGFGPGSPAPGHDSAARGPGLAGDADGTPGMAAGPQAAGTYRGLPRRVRQASLNPHLRDSASAAARRRQADGVPPLSGRSPEEARSLVASLQSGWQRGRAADTPDGESADATQTSRVKDSEAPHGEET